jgi:hypothetical protein
MKYLLLISVFFLNLNCFAEDTLPEPIIEAGKNLDLEAVGELFAQSKSLEQFEISLNTESNDVNNLDLNGDGDVNYIRIEEKVEENTRVIFLRVPLADDDVQDVATIEVERKEDGTVNVQIVGDEEIYGENYIIEHTISTTEVKKIETEVQRVKDLEKNKEKETEVQNTEEESQESKTTESAEATESATTTSSSTTVTYVYVGYAYYPYYSPYHSPYYWGYYPPYYHPYHPCSVSIYVSRSSRYRRHRYRHTTVRRSSRARNVHHSHHRSSRSTSYNYKKQSSQHKQMKQNNASKQNSSSKQKASNQQKKSSQQNSNNSTQQKNKSSQPSQSRSPSNSGSRPSRGGGGGRGRR